MSISSWIDLISGLASNFSHTDLAAAETEVLSGLRAEFFLSLMYSIRTSYRSGPRPVLLVCDEETYHVEFVSPLPMPGAFVCVS